MSELRDGWSEAPLTEVITLHDGRRIPLNQEQRQSRQGKYAYYGANGVVDHIDDYIFDGQYVLLAEDGGYFDQPERGVAYAVDGRFWVNNHAHIIEPSGGISVGFLVRWLNAIDWLPFVSGTTRLKLTQGGMQRVRIPLPPLAEQRRIVAKLDALDASAKRARADLDRIPTLVARAKQAILEKAFSGNLTTGFRAASKSALTDRRCLSALGLDQSERGEWPQDELPRGWEWKVFSAVFVDVTDSRRKLPTKEYREAGKLPIVDQGEPYIAGWSDRDDMVQTAMPPFVVFGDHTRCVKLIEIPFIQGADGVKVLKVKAEFDIQYLYFALLAVRLPDKGYSRHMKFLRATVFPWCERAEQREIVRRIEAAFAKIDRIAAEAASARALLDRLDQAILAKAFRGELVPQDPSDEPAEKLLEKIKAARAAPPARKTRKKLS
ncbi:restriction endonuclease subunit S [Methylosinus sp. H3A]|uniref:restriction endonuclease subunit S n=1 Tax=Methylosinus sp. H3A TaxID=2785786 RepID=UPI0018C1D507|nr:restriction endonuclease subunit S [Methylosinus sp. H3A]MBG0810832.1 restriction endonuclease subunit S [Methylosinus sp. H3A]